MTYDDLKILDNKESIFNMLSHLEKEVRQGIEKVISTKDTRFRSFCTQEMFVNIWQEMTDEGFPDDVWEEMTLESHGWEGGWQCEVTFKGKIYLVSGTNYNAAFDFSPKL